MMRSAWKMMNSSYVTSQDDKGHKHHYRLSAQEIGQMSPEDWQGEELLSMKWPTFRFSAIISDESARKLWKAVH